MPQRQEIAALPAEELGRFLDRVCLTDAYEIGDLRCSVCGEPLNGAGLAAVRIDVANGLVFVCQRLDCQEAFHATA